MACKPNQWAEIPQPSSICDICAVTETQCNPIEYLRMDSFGEEVCREGREREPYRTPELRKCVGTA